MEQNLKREPADYYPYFDFLRFFLASVVMFYHGDLIEWTYAGKLAVEVFFALSGWLIGGILLKTRSEDMPKFYFNRAIRIWIPYYLAFTLLILASLLKEPITDKWLEFVFYKFTWVYNIFGPPQLAEWGDMMPLDGTGNHFWSVNVEEQFYLVAPLLLVVVPKIGKSLITWCLLSVLLLFVGSYVTLCLGVIAAIVNNRFPKIIMCDTTRLISAVISIGAFILLLTTASYKLVAPIFAISIVLALTIKGKKTGAGALLGGISYPLYLNHWIGLISTNAIFKVFALEASPIEHFIYAFISYALATFLYIIVDKNP